MSARHNTRCSREYSPVAHHQSNAYHTGSQFPNHELSYYSPINTASPFVYPTYHGTHAYYNSVQPYGHAHTGLSFNPISSIAKTAAPNMFQNNSLVRDTATAFDYVAGGAVMNAALSGMEYMYGNRR